MLKIGC